MANSNSYNATGPVTDPLGQQARTIPRIFRQAAMLAAGGTLLVTPVLGVAAASYAEAPHPVTHTRAVADGNGDPCWLFYHACDEAR